ncbi:DsrE family protein [Sphingobium aromaticiconvertens]|uniref:DsrE family protein n=1 Tax=Sphingobium aromaticiconvertens TaxID=365341 RepID=UPI003017C6D9
MHPLKIVLITPDAERFRGALTLAAAQAALGGAVALFLQLDAVAMLHTPLSAPRDEAHAAAGLPTLAALLADAMTLGVQVIACQSGMTLAGLTAGALPKGIDVGGPVQFLADGADETRILIG